MAEQSGTEPPNRMHSRLARALDGIAYGLLAAAVILCHPQLGQTRLGELSNLHLIPLLGMTVATFALPDGLNSQGAWHSARWRLRLSALLALGLNPFVAWWVRTVDNAYLLTVAVAALFVALWYLLELAAALRVLFQACREQRMVTEARVARILILYFIVIPTTAVHVSFVTALIAFPGTTLSDLLRTWAFVPTFVRGLTLLAVLNLAWMLWRAPRVVLAHRPEL